MSRSREQDQGQKAAQSKIVRGLLSDAELPHAQIPTQFGLFAMLERDPAQPKLPPAPPKPPKKEIKKLIDLASVERPIMPRTPLDQWIEGSQAAERVASRVEGLATTHHPRLGPMVALGTLILKELESHLHKLVTLNKSRRAAVVQYLEELAGSSHRGAERADRSDLVQEVEQASRQLARWVDGPRTSAQNAALQVYFEEIATLVLGQAVVLKAWSDRGVRALTERDLTDLTWTLSLALKPHLPLDREGWQITRANLYSWYKPSHEIQLEIWKVLQNFRVIDEGPELLQHLLAPVRATSGVRPKAKGYDTAFCASIWKRAPLFLKPASHLASGRRAVQFGFSPTLREGTMLRTCSAPIQWLGTENDLFQLLWAELHQMWWGPQAPPLWAQSMGLDTHSREQLSLSLQSAKPSLQSRLSEMEACQFAFVFEESCIRTGSRQMDASRFKEMVDALPYFKKLKATQTTLGELQACVALSKVRPDGLMLWAREEPLTSRAGEATLQFLLDRSRLLVEWDLASLSHQLPTGNAVFPRYLYLFCRDADLQSRSHHRPLRVRAEGTVRSYVELQGILEEVWGFGADPLSPQSALSRGGLKLQKHQSPIPQKEWLDHWPDPESQSTLENLDRLRQSSHPLGAIATVRATPHPVEHDFFGWNAPQSGTSGAPTKGWKLSGSFSGLWLESCQNADGRFLRAHKLPLPNERATGSGWLVLVSDPTAVAPLTQYLQSDLVRQFLDHHAERKSDRWILSETLVRSIPLPQLLVGALRAHDRRLPGEWERVASQVAYSPKQTLEELKAIPRSFADNETAQKEIRAELFVRAARALEQVSISQRTLLSLVHPDGSVRWGGLLQILPPPECVSMTLHPAIRILGAIPNQVPILRWTQVQRPQPGILFVTESGFECTLSCDSRLMLDMIYDQLSQFVHPTWAELVQGLKLPRRVEIAETSAHDVLRRHGEILQKIRDLDEVIRSCHLI